MIHDWYDPCHIVNTRTWDLGTTDPSLGAEDNTPDTGVPSMSWTNTESQEYTFYSIVTEGVSVCVYNIPNLFGHLY